MLGTCGHQLALCQCDSSFLCSELFCGGLKESGKWAEERCGVLTFTGWSISAGNNKVCAVVHSRGWRFFFVSASLRSNSLAMYVYITLECGIFVSELFAV